MKFFIKKIVKMLLWARKRNKPLKLTVWLTQKKEFIMP